jgi:hypothetical protein
MTSLGDGPVLERQWPEQGGGAMAILSVGIMVCLAALLIPIYVADRRPASPRHQEHLAESLPLLGGMHRGQGRSVAPHRDAPASAGPEPAWHWKQMAGR